MSRGSLLLDQSDQMTTRELPRSELQAAIERFSFSPLIEHRTVIMTWVPDSLSQLVEMGLLTENDLSVCAEVGLNNGESSIISAVERLVERRRLTKYQADVICERRREPLVMGEYVILERIGAGGMGVVYKAYHRRMQRKVAIKVLLESGIQSQDKIERFRREAIAAARMNHPNIVIAFDANEHEGIPYLVMEYVEGRDLGSLVKKSGPLPVAEAVNYVLQTAQGMEYAHSQHIIHRDLKPSNVLVETPQDSDVRPGLYSRIKILDMGLARLVQPSGELVVSPLDGSAQGSDLSATGMLMGTVDYMAPEQAMDTKRADHRSDIYSLGCTLYFLLTKKPVFTGANLLERISAHLREPVPSLKDARLDAPEELDAVFQKMVAKKPRDRYQTMAEVVEALKRIDRQLNAPTGPPSIWRQPVQPGSSADVGNSSLNRPLSGSGSQGSAPTIASGSGPVGAVPGSSWGSTAYGEPEFPTDSAVITTSIPIAQRLIMVVLLGLIAGVLFVIAWRPDPPVPEPSGPSGNTVVAGTKETIFVPVPDITAATAEKPAQRVYLPPYCRPLPESKLVEVSDRGNKYWYYDVLALDVGQLEGVKGRNVVKEIDAIIREEELNLPRNIVKKLDAMIRELEFKLPPLENANNRVIDDLVKFILIPESPGLELRSFYVMENKVWNDLFRVFADHQPQLVGPENHWVQAKDDVKDIDNEARGRLPVFSVTLKEAFAFADWMGGRLPSGQQWDTATGFYIDEEDRAELLGPYRRPAADEPLDVAIDREWPVPVGTSKHDVSPFKVRDMAGNGAEFTRSSPDFDLKTIADLDGIEGVQTRGHEYQQPFPVKYEEILAYERGKLLGNGWGTTRAPEGEVGSSYFDASTSFRVVLEIP